MTTTGLEQNHTPPIGGDLNEWLTYMDRSRAAEDLVDGIFDPFGTVVLGQPFAGKTWLALNIAAALATEAPDVLGRAVRSGDHRVAYIGTDPGSLQRAAERLNGLGVTGASRERLRLERLPGRANDPSAWSRWWYHQQSRGVTVVILDNLLGASDENSDLTTTAGALPVLARLGDLANEGASVMAVGHTSKGGGGGRTTLGSVAFDAYFRRKILLSAASGSLRLDVTSNDSTPDKPLYARQTPSGWFEPTEAPIRRQAARQVKDAPRPRRRRVTEDEVASVVAGMPAAEQGNISAIGRALHEAGLSATDKGGQTLYRRRQGRPGEVSPGVN